ncbi:MAG TPA: gamma-glutamyl-gamma-aminobutyrate hydrolase family protein [Alphaproteobacteria bacterium]|nr:gamma-glutamyl-gamma-aminobutyrate hydrolase family protein [Alphaproteobacteria bacterium]
MTQTPPLIGVTACVRTLDDVQHHVARIQYLAIVPSAIGGIPVIVPALTKPKSPDDGTGAVRMTDVLDRLDGLLITGSPSNVEPAHYGGPPSKPGTLHDPVRDEAVLPLIAGALDRKLPILALCRGIQELNVVLGGTLHQNIQHLPGKMDHRADMTLPVPARYDLAHEVALTPGGVLAGFAGGTTLTVNSLHAQGIDRLAEGLTVEATAPDGVIEAVRLGDPDRFVVAIQWHPEWGITETPFAQNLFAAFGAAARAYRDGGPAATPRVAEPN